MLGKFFLENGNFLGVLGGLEMCFLKAPKNRFLLELRNEMKETEVKRQMQILTAISTPILGKPFCWQLIQLPIWFVGVCLSF